MLLFLERLLSRAAAQGIRQWVRLSGRRIARRDALWLETPLGPPGRIGAEFYQHLATRDSLHILSLPDAGLLPSFDALQGSGFDPSRVRPEIRHFYEHTACYRLEAWSEASVPTRLFLWALTRFVSRPMDQLNFPVSSLELAGGMTSEVLSMVDAAGNRRYTGWLRRQAESGRVIYTGLYTVERPAASPDPCVKVSFPVPFGSSIVFLRPAAQPDGSLTLTSAGTGFGQPGFYRILQDGHDHWYVRYIHTLREFFHVFVDRQGVLRTEHVVRLLGCTPLRLYYKLERTN